MKDKVRDFCSFFYASIRIPISWYTADGVCIDAWPDKEFALRSIPYNSSFLHNPDIYISPSHGFYGILKLPDDLGTLFLGPCYSTPVSKDILHAFIKENAIMQEYREQVSSILQAIPITAYIRFLHHLELLTYGILGKKLQLNDKIQTDSQIKTENIRQDFLEQNIQNKEEQSYHDSYLWEQQLYHYIQNGNKKELIHFFQNSSSLPSVEGQMASTPLRNAKNLFIGTVTKVGMLAAIPGGLDVEQTYQLIDTYTKECEHMQSPNEVNNLHYRMAIEFCERMSENKIPEGISEEVYLCMCFIRNHTNELISISDVAKQVHRSNSYIIGKFREELGINIGAFIRRCKLEEARSLLIYSNKSLSEISNYLGFSSQSYFQNVFKKNYGVTPMNYRKQHHNEK